MKKYRKTAIVEAVQWNGKNKEEIIQFAGDKIYFFVDGDIEVQTIEGPITGEVGDYVCKGIRGEFWSIKEDIFKETYEEIK